MESLIQNTIDRTTVQNTVLEFLRLQQLKKRKPDMLEIMNKVSAQLACSPVSVVNAVRALIRTLKIRKVTTLTSTTYELSTNL